MLGLHVLQVRRQPLFMYGHSAGALLCRLPGRHLPLCTRRRRVDDVIKAS